MPEARSLAALAAPKPCEAVFDEAALQERPHPRLLPGRPLVASRPVGPGCCCRRPCMSEAPSGGCSGGSLRRRDAGRAQELQGRRGREAPAAGGGQHPQGHHENAGDHVATPLVAASRPMPAPRRAGGSRLAGVRRSSGGRRRARSRSWGAPSPTQTRSPSGSTSHIRAVQRAVRGRRPPGALEDYRFISDLYPDMMQPYNNSGRILEALGRYPGRRGGVRPGPARRTPTPLVPLWNAYFLARRTAHGTRSGRSAWPAPSSPLQPDFANAAAHLAWSFVMQRRFGRRRRACARR